MKKTFCGDEFGFFCEALMSSGVFTDGTIIASLQLILSAMTSRSVDDEKLLPSKSS